MSEGEAVRRRRSGPGGTAGGEGSFLFGLLMAAAGAYLILRQVQVTSAAIVLFGFAGLNATSSFGLSLVPFILGVALLFFNGKSVAGWLLTGVGIVIIFAGILANLHIYIRQTTLFDFLLMVVLFVGGVGLMARGLFKTSQEEI